MKRLYLAAMEILAVFAALLKRIQVVIILLLTLFFLTITGTAFARSDVAIQLINNSDYELRVDVVAAQFKRSFALTILNPDAKPVTLDLSLPYFDATNGSGCYAYSGGSDWILCQTSAVVSISAYTAGGRLKEIAQFTVIPIIESSSNIFFYGNNNGQRTGYGLQGYAITPKTGNGATINVTGSGYDFNVSISYIP